jgi:DNA polymerase-3 subunit delta'
MRFTEIIGLHETKKFLTTSVRSGHIAHAQLFLGPSGSANLAMSLAYATFLNCENRREEDACSQCASCLKMQKFVHPDVHYVFPVSATKTITGKEVVSDSFVASWREFLAKDVYGSAADWSFSFGGENKQLNISKEESRNIIRKLSLKAFEGHYKIMLIWMPEFLHPAAANGLLKILEEPPEKTVFLLVAHNQEQILPTILSRTQTVSIRAFTDEEVFQILSKKIENGSTEISPEKIRKAAHLAEGDLNEAEKLLRNVEESSHRMFHEWMRICYKLDFQQLAGESDFFQRHRMDNKRVSWTDFFGKMGKEAQKSFLQYGLSMMRETLMMQAIAQESPTENAEKLVRIYGEERTFVSNFSKIMQWEKVEQAAQLLNEAYYHLERNANPKILFLDLSLKIAGLLKR